MNKEGCAPFLQLDLGRICAGLSGDELLEVADCIVGAALHANCTATISTAIKSIRADTRTFAAQTVVRDDLTSQQEQ